MSQTRDFKKLPFELQMIQLSAFTDKDLREFCKTDKYTHRFCKLHEKEICRRRLWDNFNVQLTEQGDNVSCVVYRIMKRIFMNPQRLTMEVYFMLEPLIVNMSKIIDKVHNIPFLTVAIRNMSFDKQLLLQLTENTPLSYFERVSSNGGTILANAIRYQMYLDELLIRIIEKTPPYVFGISEGDSLPVYFISNLSFTIGNLIIEKTPIDVFSRVNRNGDTILMYFLMTVRHMNRDLLIKIIDKTPIPAFAIQNHQGYYIMTIAVSLYSHNDEIRERIRRKSLLAGIDEEQVIIL